jgi:hypothetical protein
MTIPPSCGCGQQINKDAVGDHAGDLQCDAIRHVVRQPDVFARIDPTCPSLGTTSTIIVQGGMLSRTLFA